jgi:FkbM family methyltransferase
MQDLRNVPLAHLLNTLNPRIADVGARGGLDEDLLPIAWACSAYGFEPEPGEAARLQERADGRWRDVKILPWAVGGTSGAATLHVPEGPEGASLLEHNPAMVERFGYDNLHVTRKTITVETVTLDAIRASGQLGPVDYLKVDIEGAELDLLKSAGTILEECSALKIECSFVPQRTGQPLIWDVVPFVLEAGFDLVDISGLHRWRRRPVPAHPYFIDYAMPYSRGQVAQCDLTFLRRPETATNPRMLAMLVVMASALGYFDFAIGALRAAPGLSASIRTDYELDLESELAAWAARTGRSSVRKAFRTQLRELVPQLRSIAGRLPFSSPMRPY